MLKSIVAIALGASLGALLRWWLGLTLNSYFPAIPAGTLAANLIGGYMPALDRGPRLGIRPGLHVEPCKQGRRRYSARDGGGITSFALGRRGPTSGYNLV